MRILPLLFELNKRGKNKFSITHGVGWDTNHMGGSKNNKEA